MLARVLLSQVSVHMEHFFQWQSCQGTNVCLRSTAVHSSSRPSVSLPRSFVSTFATAVELSSISKCWCLRTVEISKNAVQ